VKFALAPKVVLLGLKDAEPRVRFFAALAVGTYGDAKAAPAVFEMLKANADADPYLRHAGVMALAGIGDKAIKQAADDPSPSVRLAGLLAMRKTGSPEVAQFLKDPEPKLVLEAARAIYDVPIEKAMPDLANVVDSRGASLAFRLGGFQKLPKDQQDYVLHRALLAQWRLGSVEIIGEVAAWNVYSEKLRIEALKLLDLWENPPGRDRVTGLWRPIGKRSGKPIAEAIRPVLPGIMTGPDKVRSEGAKLAAKHGIKEIGPLLRAMVSDGKQPAASRIAALKALESLKDGGLEAMVKIAVESEAPRLRLEARRILVTKQDPDEAGRTLFDVLDKSKSMREQQGIVGLLGDIKSPSAREALKVLLERIKDKVLPDQLELDVLDAARAWPEFKATVAAIENARPKDKSVAAFRDTLLGGDAEAGRAIFLDKAEVSCLRCHKVGGIGGEVGPDLAGIGAKRKREYLLESIINPDKEIAKGYESVVLVLLDGSTKAGILKSEDAKVVRLMNAEGQVITVAKDQIDERRRGVSAMPADLAQKMSRRELRDVIEFLANLK
jgi:quinoprotein glucose dehydrogenase